MKRVRIEEFFRDFDKLRKGKVTVTQFKSIISMLNFNLEDNELEYIATTFKTSDGMFNHSEFCDMMNSAFTIKGLDKKPLEVVAPISANATIPARRKYLEPSEEEAYAIEIITDEYKRAVQNKRVNFKPMF